MTSVSDLLVDGVQDASGNEKVLQPIGTKETLYGCILRVCRECIVYGGLAVFFKLVGPLQEAPILDVKPKHG